MGKFFADRYHAVAMRKPMQVRRTLVYVFGNARHHHVHVPQVIDDFTSGAWFKEWRERVRVRGIEDLECPVQDHESWFLHQGATGLGRISVYERPN